MGKAVVADGFHHAMAYPKRLSLLEFDRLLARGWFRMYLSVFTTSHIVDWDSCSLGKVHWLRYDLGKLRDRKSHARIRKKNNSFRADIRHFHRPTMDEEALYDRYFRSCDLETYGSISHALFDVSNRDSIFRTRAVRVWDGDRLVAMGLFDTGIVSGASILHFYDPGYRCFSIGKYLMLLTVDWLKDQGYWFYYPGYIVPGQPRFDYKLFLGKEVAGLYDRRLRRWVPFTEAIMDPEPYTKNELYAFLDVSGNHDSDKREFEAAISISCVKPVRIPSRRGATDRSLSFDHQASSPDGK